MGIVYRNAHLSGWVLSYLSHCVAMASRAAGTHFPRKKRDRHIVLVSQCTGYRYGELVNTNLPGHVVLIYALSLQIVTAILLMLTQQQAIRRDLHGQPTLAAIHDKSSAWLGLGSSVVALSLQFRMRSATWQIVLITVYLSGIFALHITTPNLFSLAALPHGAEQFTDIMVSRGMPALNNTLPNQYVCSSNTGS